MATIVYRYYIKVIYIYKMTPAVVVPYDSSAKYIQKLLNSRYDEWWVLERIIEGHDAWVYYFTFVGEAPTATAYTLNSVIS